MTDNEKIDVVVACGLNPADAVEWWQKYNRHVLASNHRNLNSALSFSEYLRKVTEASLAKPDDVGPRKGQFVLGRVGDVGNYSVDNCRFIPAEKNSQEMYENNRHDSRVSAMVGTTKETSERVRKMAETKAGRTKENDPGHAAQAEAMAKSFVLKAPDGTIHQGSNLKEFCEANGLNVFGMYNVFAGRRSHHKGWTGNYES